VRSRWLGFRSPLADCIEQFLSAKRAAKRRFDHEEHELRVFDQFLVEQRIRKAGAITPDVLAAFLVSRPRSPRSYNQLLGVVRRLFAWLVARGELRQSPVRTRPRRETDARIPFLLEPAEGRRLLEVARELRDNAAAPRRGPTYYTIFALLYGLGLRVGEVARLCADDVDLVRQLVVIRDTKFGKSRLVPFGPRMALLLEHYLTQRCPDAGQSKPDAPIFSFRRGRPIHPYTITQTFHALVPRLGLALRPGVSSPRVHDLRRSFAVRTLLTWYRQGTDPAARLLHLSTFLGHSSPVSTAVYLTITRELFDEASHRFEHFAARGAIR